MKILIINGSHRKGNTDIAIAKIKEALKIKKHEVRELILRDIEMKLPDGCQSCAESKPCPHIKDQFSEEIEPTIRDYDIYILATPTWSDNVTPLTKIFWDRIVTWCDEQRAYLNGKKLAVITHGMADENSRKHVVDWVKDICVWEGSNFSGNLSFKSDSKVGKIELTQKEIDTFINNLQ